MQASLPVETDPFPAWVVTTVTIRGNQARVYNGLYGRGHARPATMLDALEWLFRQLNHVDGTELISQPQWEGFCSMSVGDSVLFRSTRGWIREYVCEPLGWKEVR